MEQETLSTKVRILHAACFLPPVQVMVGSRVIADGLSFGMVSDYQKITDGFRRISIMLKGNAAGSAKDCGSGEDASDTGCSCAWEEIASSTLPFCKGRQITLVICNTMNSISIVPMEETSCCAGRERGCVRFANFSFGDGPFDVLDEDKNIIFSGIMPREIMPFLPAAAGDYEFCLVSTGSEYVPEAECGSGQDGAFEMKVPLSVTPEKNCTACILGGCASTVPLEIKRLES